MSNDFSEDTLVEQPAIALFKELDYETINCFYMPKQLQIEDDSPVAAEA